MNCCVARAQAGVLLSRLKFALPGWAQAEGRRAAEQRARFAQRAEQARAYSGEGHHSEEWGWPFGRPARQGGRAAGAPGARRPQRARASLMR